MGELFGWIIETFEQFWPFRKVHPSDRGVRIHGKCYHEVGPGIHLVFPLVGEIESSNIKRQTVDCDSQEVISKDKTTWRVSISINYAINNIVKALIETEDFDDSIVVEAQNLVAEWLNGATDKDITISRLKEACFRPIRREGFRWGLVIESIGVNNLSPIKMYRLVTDVAGNG